MTNNQVRADIELRLKKVNVDRAKADIMGDVRQEISREAGKILEGGMIGTKGDAGRLYQNYKLYSESALKALEQIEKTPTYKRAQSIFRNLQTGGLNPEEMKAEARKLNTVLGQLGREGWKTFGKTMGPWDEAKMAENLRTGFKGLGGRKGQTGLELVDLVESLPGIFERTTDKFKVSIDEFNKKVGDGIKQSAVRISYVASVANMAIGFAKTYAQYQRVSQTMFDLNSPQGMMSSLIQREMAQRTLAYGGTGRAIGSIGGPLIAAALGHPELAFFASYLGGEVAGGIGDTIANFENIPAQKKLQVFSSMWGWAGRNEQALEQLQASTYHAAGRMGWRVAPETMEKLFGQSAGSALPSVQQVQYAEGLIGARGRFDTDEIRNAIRVMVRDRLSMGEGITLEKFGRLTGAKMGGEARALENLRKKIGLPGYQELIPALLGIGQQAARYVGPGRVGEATGFAMNLPAWLYPGNSTYGNIATPEGQQTLQAFNRLVTPQGEAENALLFGAFTRGAARRGERTDPFATMFRMKQGVFGKGNLSDLLSFLPNRNMRYMALPSMLLNSDLNPDISQKMIGRLTNISATDLKKLTGASVGTNGEWNKTLSEIAGVPLSDLNNKVTPGETKAAELFASAADSAKKIQESFLDMQVKWQKAQNVMVGDGALLTSMFDDSVKRMWEIFNEVMYPDKGGAGTPYPGAQMETGGKGGVVADIMKRHGGGLGIGPAGSDLQIGEHTLWLDDTTSVTFSINGRVEKGGAPALNGTGRTRK